jgi:sterol desaturase/sphingolipid hydroxylase (fatty acid hydroxylase superfamily)
MKYKAIHDIKPKNNGSSKMFENPFLNKLTITDTSIPISMLVLFGIGFLFYGIRYSTLEISQYFILVFSGIFSWTLFEYLMHRYMYHMIPTNNMKGWIQYNMHGLHHEYPKDKMRLAMPPIAIISISFAFLYIFKLILGDFTYGFTPGFLLGYAAYLYVHYLIHARRRPKNAFKVLWVNHSIHHYKNADVAFGVSSPFWDYVFRTLPEKKTK